MKPRVRIRNNGARKVRNRRRNLAIRENVATIQPAGSGRFVKSSNGFSTIRMPPATKQKHITVKATQTGDPKWLT
jgi:hypothetical protein